jgi:hypothetical protein
MPYGYRRSRKWGVSKRRGSYRGATYGGGPSRFRRGTFRGRSRYMVPTRNSYRRSSGALRTTNWNRSADELKYLDINSASYACGTTGAITLINGVAAGSTAITREGRQAYWKSVQVSGSMTPTDATVIGSRNDVFVVWDKQPGAAVPAMTEIFVQAIAGSPMNLNYRERFMVLAHETFVLGAPIADGASITPNVHAVNIMKRLALRTTFKGDANAIGDIGTGAMYLVTLGDQADASCGVLRASVRLRFAERLF